MNLVRREVLYSRAMRSEPGLGRAPRRCFATVHFVHLEAAGGL